MGRRAAAAPTGELCAIHSGSVQCYGEDGSFGRYVESVYEDRARNIWVGASSGLWRWKPVPPKLYPTPDRVQSLLEVDNGALVIAMLSGIRQLVQGNLMRIHFRLAGGGSQPVRSSRIAMAECGLERRIGDSSMYIREERIYLNAPTVSRAISLNGSLRIVKVTFGSPR